MQAINRSLLALALCSIIAAPALAGDKPPSTKKPTTSTSTDAVSARATMREAGKTKPPAVSTSTDTNVSAQDSNPGKGNWWAEADIDGDGKLSAAEAKAQAGLDARFSSVDADADGFVTNEEYRKFFTSEKSQGETHAAAHSAVVTRDVWAKLDANSDGKLSSSEIASDTALSGAFSAMDSNGDGFVTDAEYRAYAKTNLKK
jgi:Ca2+-binding EF-hand superfamily protein